MLHGHHAAARTIRGSDQNAWVIFGKQEWVSSRARRSNFVGQHFWARGYFVSTIGPDEAQIRT